MGFFLYVASCYVATGWPEPESPFFTQSLPAESIESFNSVTKDTSGACDALRSPRPLLIGGICLPVESTKQISPLAFYVEGCRKKYFVDEKLVRCSGRPLGLGMGEDSEKRFLESGTWHLFSIFFKNVYPVSRPWFGKYFSVPSTLKDVWYNWLGHYSSKVFAALEMLVALPRLPRWIRFMSLSRLMLRWKD